MRLLESIVHPFVETSRNEFVSNHRVAGQSLAVVDIPLLFEIGGEQLVDVVVVVSAAEETQRQRAFARQNMTLEKFEAIKAKQIPDTQKRMRAHYVVSSDYGFDHTRCQIEALIRALS